LSNARRAQLEIAAGLGVLVALEEIDRLQVRVGRRSSSRLVFTTGMPSGFSRSSHSAVVSAFEASPARM